MNSRLTSFQLFVVLKQIKHMGPLCSRLTDGATDFRPAGAEDRIFRTLAKVGAVREPPLHALRISFVLFYKSELR